MEKYAWMSDDRMVRFLDVLRMQYKAPKPSGNGWMSRCPAHDDTNPSLSIKRGDDGRVLVHCHAGCTSEQVVASLGMEMRDLFPADTARGTACDRSASPTPAGAPGASPVLTGEVGFGAAKGRRGSSEEPTHNKTPSVSLRSTPPPSGTGEAQRDGEAQIGVTADDKHPDIDQSLRDAMAVYTRSLGVPTGWWDYHDAHTNRVGIVLRWDTESGKQIRPISRIDGQWVLKGMPEPRPLYRLPELLNSDGPIIVCEGEKATDAAVACGYVATTSPHGSKGADKADWSAVRDRDVVIVPDLDDAGEAYASRVHELVSGIARSVKIIDLRAGWDTLMEGDDLDDALCLCDGDAARVREVVDGLIESAAHTKTPSVPPLADHLPRGAGKERTRTTKQPLGFSRAETYVPTDIHWLVDGRIAMGKLNILAGDPGLGKSFISLELASRVSRGEIGRRPDGSIGSAVIMSAEDDACDTMVPRLIAMGADRSRIRFVDGFLDEDGFPMLMDLKRDATEFGKWIEEWGDVSLIVIDPISAYMGETDSHKNAEVRGVLGRLAQMGALSGAAVLCVTHLNKDNGNGQKAIYRTTGSLAFTAASRIVQLVTKYDGDDPTLVGTRVVSMVKNNLGPMLDAMLYRIDDGKLVWLDTELPGDADVFTNGQAKFVSGETKGDRAVALIEDTLAHGPCLAREILERAKKMGLSKTQMTEARQSLRVQTVKTKEGWVWSNPDQDIEQEHNEPTNVPDGYRAVTYGDQHLPFD